MVLATPCFLEAQYEPEAAVDILRIQDNPHFYGWLKGSNQHYKNELHGNSFPKVERDDLFKVKHVYLEHNSIRRESGRTSLIQRFVYRISRREWHPELGWNILLSANRFKASISCWRTIISPLHNAGHFYSDQANPLTGIQRGVGFD